MVSVHMPLDLAADEPEWPPQEFFNVFLPFAECAGCGHLSEPTDFDKLERPNRALQQAAGACRLSGVHSSLGPRRC